VPAGCWSEAPEEYWIRFIPIDQSNTLKEPSHDTTTSTINRSPEQVCFQWKDYRDQQQQKEMTVSAEEFIRRFQQHALPPRFQRVRYYGFLANCHRAAKLKLCRRLLATPCSDLLPCPNDCRDLMAALTASNLRLCPQCAIGNQ
jgi:hypothetical protein